jgi:protein-S-isoprenylcysteine O-methyltransferase Ste14
MLETDAPTTAELGAAGSPPPGGVARILLDLFERAFCLGLFSLLAVSLYRAVGQGANWYSLAILAGEGITVVLILIRKPAKTTSYRPLEQGVAFVTSAGSLLVRPAHLYPVAPNLAGALILCGFIGQVWSKLALGRSFGVIPANRGIKLSGPYRWVRHPIYFSYLLGWVGFLMLNPTFWNGGVYTLCLIGQMFRMDAEERVLGRDPSYADYAEKVRYRLIPGVY